MPRDGTRTFTTWFNQNWTQNAIDYKRLVHDNFTFYLWLVTLHCKTIFREHHKIKSQSHLATSWLSSLGLDLSQCKQSLDLKENGGWRRTWESDLHMNYGSVIRLGDKSWFCHQGQFVAYFIKRACLSPRIFRESEWLNVTFLNRKVLYKA